MAKRKTKTEGMAYLTVALPAELLESLRLLAKAEDRPISAYCRRILAAEAERHA